MVYGCDNNFGKRLPFFEIVFCPLKGFFKRETLALRVSRNPNTKGGENNGNIFYESIKCFGKGVEA